MERTLPSEIYVNIFRHLSQKELRECVSLVCSKWYDLVQDFYLVENRLILNSPLSLFIEKVLEDFESDPSFLQKVKDIIIKDRREYENINRSAAEFYSVVVPGLLGTLVESCPNIQTLKIWLHLISDFFNFFQATALTNQPIGTKLKILKVYFNDMDYSRKEPYTCEKDINLDQLLNTIPSLQQLIFQSFNKYEDYVLFFKNVDTSLINTSCINRIVIDSPHSRMTVSCLMNIVSGQLFHLKDLNLFLGMVFPRRPAMSDRRQKDDIVFKKLKNLCLTTLEKYNVFLSGYYNIICLFSMDNCVNDEDRYATMAEKNLRRC